MATLAKGPDYKTPLAIVAYAHNLFELNDKNKYGASFLFKKGSDISVLENAALEVAKMAWGDKAVDMIKNEIIKTPFLDGDGKQGKHKETGEPHKGFPGHRFIRATSGPDFKPKIWDKKRNPIFEKAECPSGSQVYGVVNAFAWQDDEGGKGITFGISHVQVVKKAEGEEVLGGGGGGPDPDKFFEKIEDEGDAPAETKGGAGAAGLFG